MKICSWQRADKIYRTSTNSHIAHKFSPCISVISSFNYTLYEIYGVTAILANSRQSNLFCYSIPPLALDFMTILINPGKRTFK